MSGSGSASPARWSIVRCASVRCSPFPCPAARITRRSKSKRSSFRGHPDCNDGRRGGRPSLSRHCRGVRAVALVRVRTRPPNLAGARSDSAVEASRLRLSRRIAPRSGLRQFTPQAARTRQQSITFAGGRRSRTAGRTDGQWIRPRGQHDRSRSSTSRVRWVEQRRVGNAWSDTARGRVNSRTGEGTAEDRAAPGSHGGAGDDRRVPSGGGDPLAATPSSSIARRARRT